MDTTLNRDEAQAEREAMASEARAWTDSAKWAYGDGEPKNNAAVSALISIAHSLAVLASIAAELEPVGDDAEPAADPTPPE